MKLKLSTIAEYCGGELHGSGDIYITGFFTDSRSAEPGKMFVPIKGENVDGHKFIPDVFKKGCEAVFSQIPLENGNYILVDDSRAALQKTAEKYRENLKIPVIGITGSVGKTTTKEMVSLVLSSSLNILKTAGNANSQIGLPLTVFRIEPEHEAAVLEMGMSLPGEMERLAKVAKPDFAIMTNIGTSHIEFHGTRENILKQKIHIADYIGENGALIVNGDDDLLSGIKGTFSRKVLTFGTSDDCDFKAENITENDGITYFDYVRMDKTYPVILPALGMHNVRNALAAFAAAEVTGIPAETAVEAVKDYAPLDMRQQIKKVGDITVIDDTYNASPDSMISSLSVLGGYKNRKVAVLADMLELGSYSEKGHTDVGIHAAKEGVNLLVTVGKEARFINKGYGISENSFHFTSNEDASEFLFNNIQSGDVILVKGSRGMHMEKIVEDLLRSK